MEKTLDSCGIGEGGVVVRVTAEGKLRRRLFDMGVTPGARVELRRVAPLGDPIEIALRGYRLSVRRTEAAGVILNAEGEESV